MHRSNLDDMGLMLKKIADKQEYAAEKASHLRDGQWRRRIFSTFRKHIMFQYYAKNFTNILPSIR